MRSGRVLVGQGSSKNPLHVAHVYTLVDLLYALDVDFYDIGDCGVALAVLDYVQKLLLPLLLRSQQIYHILVIYLNETELIVDFGALLCPQFLLLP